LIIKYILRYLYNYPLGESQKLLYKLKNFAKSKQQAEPILTLGETIRYYTYVGDDISDFSH